MFVLNKKINKITHATEKILRALRAIFKNMVFGQVWKKEIHITSNSILNKEKNL